MSATDHGIYENLRGTVCACGGAKKDGKSFCAKHYFKLPKPERDALYRREGCVDTYRRCLRLLGLEEPKLQARDDDESATVRRLRNGLRRSLG